MKSRGFLPTETRIFPDKIFINNNLYNDWVPDNDDFFLIRKRINQKIQMKPNWHRKTIYIISN